jgi:toxin ParE1/3/4
MGSIRDFRNPEMKGLRMLPLPKFKNYLLFYRPTSERLEIVRVLHGARDVRTLFE